MMPAEQTNPTATQLDLAIRVHDGLAKLVAPASPGSIDASTFDPRRNMLLFLVGAVRSGLVRDFRRSYHSGSIVWVGCHQLSADYRRRRPRLVVLRAV